MYSLTRTAALIALVTMCICAPLTRAQEMVKPESLDQGFVLVVKDLSGRANADNPIYFASSINGWDPADPDRILSGRSDTRWQIVIDQGLQGVGLEFKFTLGGWDREELDTEGNPIANRKLPMVDASTLSPGERPIIELEVADFRVPQSLAEQVRESGFYRELRVTGDVHRVQVQGGAGMSQSVTRDLLVWTPPGYNDPANAGRQYPVLYMFDGQNIFEQLPGVPGEWHADETATELIESGWIEPVVIVGIPHGGVNRLEEYLPFGAYRGVTGRGSETMAWVMREVKPKVERAFRVRTDRGSVALGGASLGGAMALYGSTAYPDAFGMALVESLPMMADEGASAIRYIRSIERWPDKVFIGMGGSEVGAGQENEERNALYRSWAKRVARMASQGGVPESGHRLMVVPGAVHTESAWAERFDEALMFLFGLE